MVIIKILDIRFGEYVETVLFFVGMDDKLIVCYLDKDLIFACNWDYQCASLICKMVFTDLQELFVDTGRIEKNENV